MPTLASARADAEISLEHLPEHVREPVPAAPAVRGDGEERRALIVQLLEEHAGNLSAVARALGTSRSQLRRLAERFGIDRSRDR